MRSSVFASGAAAPGHPERGRTPGVEVTTGPLGQGLGNGVGMAIAEAHLAARFNRPGFALLDHYTYAIASDGDLMEGISSEAASLAGHLQLGKLIYLYDNNHVSLASSTNLTFTEDRRARFDAYGWHTVTVEDGQRPGGHRPGAPGGPCGNRTPVADPGPHPHRLWLSAQAGHFRGARVSAWS